MRRRWLKGVLLGLFIGLGGAILGMSSLGEQFELNVGKAWLFTIRGAVTPPSNIAVVGINGQTGKQLGLPASPRDWRRTIHAKLIDDLFKRGAAVVAFDVFFKSHKKPADDLAFAKAIRQAGRVVLVEKLTGEREPITDSMGRYVGMVWVAELIAPRKMFAEAAKGLAPFPLPKIDASVHDFWTFKSTANDSPTMPAIALQIYDLPLYPLLSGILKQLQVPGSDSLPVSAAHLGLDDHVGKLMSRIRHMYRVNPGVADKVAALIRAGKYPGSSATLSKQLLALNRLYGGGQQRYINFYGPPGTIETIPYQAVIKGHDPNLRKGALDFHNKIVFVGFSDLYDPEQPDRFYSVFSTSNGIDLSGVEIMATACGNLMHDTALATPGVWQTGGLLLVFGLTMTMLIYLLPAIGGVPLSIALSVLYAIGAQWLFNQHDYWLPMATPMLVQFPLALFLGLMGQYFLERRRGQHIRQTLNYYIPENYARELTENRLDPSAANKVVYSICLATDMAGFSTLAEKMPPDKLALVLNDYFDTLAQPLKKHHVDVTEFRADAIMCAWTAAAPEIEIRRKAVSAALDAVQAIESFKQRYSEINTDIRIGLEAGTVYVGHAGGGGHFVFSIVGDCANTASRVESLNKHLKTNLLATDSVLEGLDNLLIRPLSKFQFVGKSEALPIAEILASQDTASAQQREFCARFADALDLFHKARWDQAQVAFVRFLERYPDDGPSKFYLSWCQRYLSGETDTDEPQVIRMDAK